MFQNTHDLSARYRTRAPKNRNVEAHDLSKVCHETHAHQWTVPWQQKVVRFAETKTENVLQSSINKLLIQ